MPIPVRGFNPTTSAVDVLPATVAVTLDSRVVVNVARATPDELDTPGRNRIHLVVPDLRAEIDRLTAAGLTVPHDVVTGPGGQQVLITDPAGNLVELFQPAGDASH